MGQDPKDPKDPQRGTPPGTPPGNPDPNVVALQQKLTERDKELKETKAKLAELEKKGSTDDATRQTLEGMQKTIETLSGTIGTMETEKEREKLAKAYPDIVPDLLIGKSQDEIERLVKAQRDTIEQNYSRLPSAHGPAFADRSSVEAAIKAVTEDRSISTEAKFVKIRELKEALAEF